MLVGYKPCDKDILDFFHLIISLLGLVDIVSRIDWSRRQRADGRG